MSRFEIRQHDRNPNLWWVSSQGDDVAYITRPGNAYLVWTTGTAMPAHAEFIGKRFDSIDAALEAAAIEHWRDMDEETDR